MISRLSTRRFSAIAAAIVGATAFAGCTSKDAGVVQVQTEPVRRRDISVSTDATGTVEPVDTVAVKSQASGLIIKMPVEVGTEVKVGALIAQIDTRNLINDYQRAVATQQAAQSTLVVNQSALRRADALLAQGVITTAEHETAIVNEANARSALVTAQTNLRVAKQNIDYATVRAEVAGTIISKTASVGTVASSATSNVGGGSTIVTIADLSRVRMSVLVNETDIANVHPGQAAKVSIDALPNQVFDGVVEKVEPQAVIQQSVTMFPVLVSLQNPSRTLLPGMNGEVTMITQDRPNAIAIPNDAIRGMKDLPSIALALGINIDSMRASMKNRRGGAGAGVGAGASTGTGGRTGAVGTPPSGATMNAGKGAAQFVFVKEGTAWVPHRVKIGVSNYDYSEALSGVKEGDEVALLAAVLAQQQRNQQQAQVRSMTGNGLPGTAAGSGARGGAGRTSGGGR